MGYHLTTSPDQPATRSHASPKTHTPLPRLQERGHRFYSPEMGRWLNRDPLVAGSNRSSPFMGFTHLYRFCAGNSVDLWDALGLMTRGEEAWLQVLQPQCDSLANDVRLDEMFNGEDDFSCFILVSVEDVTAYVVVAGQSGGGFDGCWAYGTGLYRGQDGRMYYKTVTVTLATGGHNIVLEGRCRFKLIVEKSLCQCDRDNGRKETDYDDFLDNAELLAEPSQYTTFVLHDQPQGRNICDRYVP